MKLKRYPIGFWNYTPVGQLGPEAVKDWADLGMTFALSPQFGPNSDPKILLSILDACADRDIGVILNDYRARWNGASDDPKAYADRFRAAYEQFGKHPAAIGFHVGDEPSDDKGFADACEAHRIQLAVAPELTPHLNFLPYWEGQEKNILKAPTFADWAKRMAKEADLKILCYDCYAQMNPEETGTHQYYTNLRKFSEAADASGILPWTTLLSVGHFRYRIPSEDDFRWQVNTAAASGMKGLLWFFVYAVMIANYRLSPIDEFGDRTETFSHLSRVNRLFLHEFGDFFLKAEHRSTWHTGKAYGGYSLFEAGKTDPLLLDVTCEQGLPGLVGLFELDGKRYFAIVNNSPKENGCFVLHLPKGAKTFQRLNWNGGYDDLRVSHHDAYYRETEDEIQGGDWLAPGQMKIYRIEQ
ncbi:MAG: hypothetical protein J5938_04470 [Clostridia bacterium]|nr:hypothetical protein [Clostridia bacterium]